jgi:type II secretory pathway pseudopilin PulG
MNKRMGEIKKTLSLRCKAEQGCMLPEDGFGLIEVVVAALILLIFAIMLLSANITSLSMSLLAKERATATSIMTATIAQAEAAGYNGAPSAVASSSKQTISDITYTISYSVTSGSSSSSTTTTTSSTGLYTVSVNVSWQNDGATYSVNGATQIAQ